MWRPPRIRARSPQKYSTDWWDRWVEIEITNWDGLVRVWILNICCLWDMSRLTLVHFLCRWSRTAFSTKRRLDAELIAMHQPLNSQNLTSIGSTSPWTHCHWCVKTHRVYQMYDNLCNVLWWKPNPVMEHQGVMIIHFQSWQVDHVDKWSTGWTWWDSCLGHWLDVRRPQQWDQQGGIVIKNINLEVIRYQLCNP